MCRAIDCKKKIAGAAFMLSLFGMTGCSLARGLMTDTGSGKKQQIAREEYLRLAEENADGADAENGPGGRYQVLTLTRGTFEEEALRQSMNRVLNLNDFPALRLQLGVQGEPVQVKFGEYVAEYMNYVEKGDVIATVHVERDEVAVEEAQIALSRLQQRYAEAEERMQEELERLEEQLLYLYEEDNQIGRIEYRQRQLDWQNESYRYESQIAEAARRVQKLTGLGEQYEIRADRDGYVYYISRWQQGQELQEGDYICHIMSDDKLYVSTDLQAENFPYGKRGEFEVRIGMGTSVTVPGQVVNGGGLALYGNLDTDKAVFQLELGEDVPLANRTNITLAVLNTGLKTIDNVIVVPRQAVTEENNQYYVTVLREDGSLVKTEFLPGGSNLEEYWVLQGLTEGMQIVYKAG